MAAATSLEELWKSGPVGYLTPLDQIRAWAYREALREVGHPEHGLYTKVAAKVPTRATRRHCNAGPSPAEFCDVDRLEGVSSLLGIGSAPMVPGSHGSPNSKWGLAIQILMSWQKDVSWTGKHRRSTKLAVQLQSQCL